MPKVSVCIPIYGVEKYIERCARSLFAQTMTDGIEFIFVNDCTKDKSIEILEKVLTEYPQRQSQTQIINHEVNAGLVAARNTALKHASGDYIIHCDSDDWVDSDFYEKLYKKAIESNADVVCAPFVKEFSESCHPSTEIYPEKTKDVDGYIIKNAGTHLNSLWSKLYRREIALNQMLDCPDWICHGEDLLRNIQMLDKCQNIAFIQDSFYHYWQNSASITHNFTEKHFINLKGVLDILSQKYVGKYFFIHRQIKQTMLLASLRNLHRDIRLILCFNEIWSETSLGEKLSIVFLSRNSLKSKIAVISSCISRPLTIFILKQIN